jgi:hypothetical protein
MSEPAVTRTPDDRWPTVGAATIVTSNRHPDTLAGPLRERKPSTDQP